MVMDQGYFHIVDNDVKFTITRKLPFLPKSSELQLNKSVDFISDLSFFTCTHAKSYWNFRSIAILHVSVASVWPQNFY